MKQEDQIESRPSKPILIYDGDCGLCCKWVERSSQITAGAVDHLPSAEAIRLFPDIPARDYERAVQLLRPDGSRCSGAEAILEILSPRSWSARVLLGAYRRRPILRTALDFCYRLVAANRRTISFITRKL